MHSKQRKTKQTASRLASDQLAAAPEQSALERLEQAESELESIRAEFEHSQRLASLGTLAAGIAHEINNVLTPVLAYAQLASNNPNDPQLTAKAIDKALCGVQLATQITQAMLGFAGNPSERSFASLHEVVRSAMDCIGRDPAKDNIKLTIDFHPETAVVMRPLALQQVMMNLILNACNVLRGRGGELAIAATNQPVGKTCITITDSGPGIPSEIVGRLFEPFATSRLTSKRAAGAKSSTGTGLGLSICRRLVEEAGGTIAASSAPGRGTTFTIVLPTKHPKLALAS